MRVTAAAAAAAAAVARSTQTDRSVRSPWYEEKVGRRTRVRGDATPTGRPIAQLTLLERLDALPKIERRSAPRRAPLCTSC